MVSVWQFFATVELGANKSPLLASASLAFDLFALQRSRRPKGLVVSIVAATKLAGGGSFDLHFVFHCAYSLIEFSVDYKNYLLILWYDSGYQPDKVFQNAVEVGGLPDLTTTTGASLKGHRKPLVSPAVNDDGPGTGATGGGVLVAREHETEFIGEDVELFVIHCAYSLIDDAGESKKKQYNTLVLCTLFFIFFYCLTCSRARGEENFNIPTQK
ncbi:MAG: hypothetical protein DWQ49_01050 [Bacteroidetes bacterium]|nr:MAG: hypothetical protein DWQ49_01050 [Bacteroidota bacterium]